MLSDALHGYGNQITDTCLEVLAFGCLSPHHAGQFKAFVKQIHSQYRLAAIVKGDSGWPYNPEDRDVLYYLSQSFRAQLIKELPTARSALADGHKAFAHRAKALIKDLASISLEMAQMLVSGQGGDDGLPDWFMVAIVRDLPRLVDKKDGT